MKRKDTSGYAYLGEVTVSEFNAITVAFPNIVGVGTIPDSDNETEMLIVLGISKELPDEVIGLHQLIVFIWGDGNAREKCWDACS